MLRVSLTCVGTAGLPTTRAERLPGQQPGVTSQQDSLPKPLRAGFPRHSAKNNPIVFRMHKKHSLHAENTPPSHAKGTPPCSDSMQKLSGVFSAQSFGHVRSSFLRHISQFYSTCIRTHKKDHVRTLKILQVNVRVRWITETRKDQACTEKSIAELALRTTWL